MTNLGWKIFIVYATINVGAMGTFSLVVPETKARSLKEMDVIFGAISTETRRWDIERQRANFERPGYEDLSSTSSNDDVRVQGPSCFS